ncbi:MAG: CHAT domain-containing protein, partial [Bacteroidota bacterium]
PTAKPAVLHLSTHASMDDRNPMGGKIYLADGDITVKEIYTFPYATQLAVLSGCETGTGQLQSGEGLISLARAFMQSGTPSVVTSLWQVDDKATGDIMINFYNNLLTKQQKPRALQKAKLDFMATSESEILHHPYYWAAFIQIGNTEQVAVGAGSKYWWWALGVAGLLLFFVGRYFLFSGKGR